MDMIQTAPQNDTLIQLTSNIVSSYLSNHNVPAGDIPSLIQTTYEALQRPVAQTETPARREPAVPVNKSIDKKGEFIICLEDGKPFKSMKRHLANVYNLTPEQYREKWNLPSDYPMVAPEYAQRRSNLAKEMGLGRGNGSQAA
ncbi:MucR family transcriptional regulator [Rhizobium sp. BK176]|uniref:MucR family transcriptional regulator n=1 Tax=Rhizobium sp. BK176 TaxID=2587071 RepID=UPI00286E03D8|nr:MucR family transcriptional regulator [Rhizobium sp. BK176]MCS4089653.1 putative transcriptional regulator [Rhizobium sp. BK176]